MDFSRILDEWEHRSPSPTPSKDETPASKTTRAEMEKARVEDELDLHGLARDEAAVLLKEFLRQSSAEGRRKVLIIHGKGLHSEDGRGVLLEAVRLVLSKNKNVAAWGEADRKQGGRGASWVWLSARGK